MEISPKTIKLKVADVVFTAVVNYRYVVNMTKKYEYFGEEPSEFTAKIEKADIDFERSNCTPDMDFSDGYLESLALFRKLCEYVFKYKDGLIFHSSAMAVDGNAYLLAAPSGTGKSTHAKLWRELLGDKVIMVNDDKPIIRKIDGKFYVYGTPWNGKHSLDTDTKVKIKAIAKLGRGKENSIAVADVKDMIFTMLNQTIRFSDEKEMDKLLSLIGELITSVDIYDLKCNMDISAAKLSYKTMSGDNYE